MIGIEATINLKIGTIQVSARDTLIHLDLMTDKDQGWRGVAVYLEPDACEAFIAALRIAHSTVTRRKYGRS